MCAASNKAVHGQTDGVLTNKALFERTKTMVEKAVESLEHNNGRSLNHGRSKQEIVEYIAEFLQSELETYSLLNVDTKYSEMIKLSRKREIIKKILKKLPASLKEENAERFSRITVKTIMAITPEIVIRSRGTDILNMLVVFVRKRGSIIPEEFDIAKLGVFTDPRNSFSYSLGVLIEFGGESPACLWSKAL